MPKERTQMILLPKPIKTRYQVIDHIDDQTRDHIMKYVRGEAWRNVRISISITSGYRPSVRPAYDQIIEDLHKL